MQHPVYVCVCVCVCACVRACVRACECVNGEVLLRLSPGGHDLTAQGDKGPVYYRSFQNGC